MIAKLFIFECRHLSTLLPRSETLASKCHLCVMELHHLVYGTQPSCTPAGARERRMPPEQPIFRRTLLREAGGACKIRTNNDAVGGDRMAESPRPRRSAGTWFQSLYVRVLLRLLPHLINVFKHVSPKIRAEVDYLEPGYTFMLSVNGTDLACACRRTASGSFKRVPPPPSPRTWSPAAAWPAPTRRPSPSTTSSRSGRWPMRSPASPAV